MKDWDKKFGWLTFFMILYMIIASLFTAIIGLFILTMAILYFLYRENHAYITKKDIMIASILTILAALFGILNRNVPLAVIVIITTMSSYITGIATFKAHQIDYPLVKNRFLVTILIIIIVGSLLAIPNTYFALGQNMVMDPKNPMMSLVTALQPGIWEEVAYRFIFFAFSLQILGRLPQTGKESVCTYLMMTIPHAIAHYPPGNIINTLVSTIVMSLIFGLPFAFLQRKVDLLTAIGAHTLVDWFRFLFFQM